MKMKNKIKISFPDTWNDHSPFFDLQRFVTLKTTFSNIWVTYSAHQGVFLFLTSCVWRDEKTNFLWDWEEFWIYKAILNKLNAKILLLFKWFWQSYFILLVTYYIQWTLRLFTKISCGSQNFLCTMYLSTRGKRRPGAHVETCGTRILLGLVVQLYSHTVIQSLYTCTTFCCY